MRSKCIEDSKKSKIPVYTIQGISSIKHSDDSKKNLYFFL